MNSCVLMAEIIQEPELRFTADNQLEITEMLVQFSSVRESDPPSNLKVVGFGEKAKEIQRNYHIGDRVILIGRLSMNTIERPEGFKEKRAELTVQQIQHVGGDVDTAADTPTNLPVSPSPQPQPVKSTPQAIKAPVQTPIQTNTDVADENYPSSAPQPEFYEPSTYPGEKDAETFEDDIPFVRPVYSKTSWVHELCDSFELEANAYWEGVEQLKP